MNERIKELGRQAGFAFIEDGVYGERWYSSKCGMDKLEFEKFAELIVRECIDWCNANARDDGTAQRIAEDIKKDFGVEE